MKTKKSTTPSNLRSLMIGATAHSQLKKIANKKNMTMREWTEKALKAYKPS